MFLDWFRRKRSDTGSRLSKAKVDVSSSDYTRRPYVDRLERLLEEVSSALVVERPEGGTDVSGTVAVCDGKVVVTDPVGRGIFPTICPGPGVIVYVNGKAVRGTTVVTSRSTVELFAPPRKPTCDLKVRISESELEAELTIQRTNGQELCINDAPPTPRLTVTATVVQETEPPPVTVEDVLHFLAENGVTQGVDANAVMRAVAQSGTVTVTVARGEPPLPGEDAWIEYFFPEDIFVARVFDENAQVDPREREEVVCVTEGSVLARKYPARAGTPGFTVTGRLLPPATVQDVTLRAGDGVTILEDGAVAVAVRQGRPLLRNGVLSVLPVFVLDQDVDANTGNISFNGHLVIKGNVMSGFKVTATGDIKLLGSAEQATIIAGGNVDVRGNLIGCSVRAGGLDAVSSSLILQLEELAFELELLVRSVQEVKAHPSYRRVGAALLDNDGPLIRLLLDKKFDEIPKVLGAILSEGDCLANPESLDFLRACGQRYKGLGPVGISSADEVAADVRALKRLVAAIRASVRDPSDLLAGYAQNCTLEASGRVWVIGEGCYNCEVRAGQEVRVEGRTGIFRGGSITSGGNVRIGWLGAPSGSPTRVNFLQGRRVTADTVEANVIFRAGRQVVSVSEAGRWLEVCLDQRGLLRVTKLKAWPKPEEAQSG